MYKLILAPVDGSNFSEQVLPHAAAIARSTGAELLVVRAVSSEKDRAEAARYVEALAGKLGARSACVVSDDIPAAIVAEAARLPETLVALSSHGRTGAMQALFGSTALAVLRASHAPLLVYRPDSVRPVAPVERIERIVLPLDGSPASESMIAPAAGLAKWLGARIDVVNVVDPSAGASAAAGDASESGYARSRAEAIAREHGVKTSWEVLHGDPKEAIPDFVKGQGAGGLLAMTTHGRGGLRSVLAGSVTAACLNEVDGLVFTKLP
ncbi:universal stress protein [Quisquiliibacterium transsilvanicum]|uniref:Nucleotide-binding universal stress UspA family protein n=1 Tax=Quisquiliibacterium transsilvanicum TaxID=1549638 RepID=A0A7W8HF44_9BURK|nr:universal stress protein [Quisquiliibacterium transsilvanicum]MBB5270909.1 nucleotide-binding universal stress UspA family protein [Quisquiliibacterium transsilvanicum]